MKFTVTVDVETIISILQTELRHKGLETTNPVVQMEGDYDGSVFVGIKFDAQLVK